MAGNVGVELSVLTTTATNVRSYNANMKSNLTSIGQAVRGLESTWQSPASAKLSALAGNMEARFSELEKSVESFAAFIDTVIRNYDITESAAQQIVSDVENQFKA